MNVELGKLVLNAAGRIVFELQPTHEVLTWLAGGMAANALPSAVNETQSTSSDIRARKRGRPAKVTHLRLNPEYAPNPTEPTALAIPQLTQPKPKRERRPDFRLSPKEYRDTLELLLNIHEAVDYYWRLDKANRSAQSLSHTYKQLIIAWYQTTDYRARHKLSLGRVDRKQTRLNTIIRDGKGPEFLAFVRAEARILNAETVRV